MSRKHNKHNTRVSEIALMARRADRERRMAALADGRKTRSVTFTDRKKESNRRECRGKVMYG